jgi:DNA-binding transcriptional regulator YiaG
MTIKQQMKGADVTALRTRLKIGQSEFWKRVGTTQSTGSRYEHGNRTIPKTMRILLTLAYSHNPMPVFNRLRHRADKRGR